jgi:transposase-like protein
MNPSDLFCPNPECPKHGQLGTGNIVCHSWKERRCRCVACGKTFAATKGTPYYRLHTEHTVFTLVVTLLAYGCPPQAIVHAFGLDERTVQAWALRAGTHCQQLHAEWVEAGQVEAPQVQADELWVKMVGRKVWLALALAVTSRLWLGGVISRHRDGELIRDLALAVRRCLAGLGILLCVDGFGSYVTQFRRVFRVPERRPPGSKGKPRQVLPDGFLLGQVIKRYVKKRVTEVSQRAVCGSLTDILTRVRATGGTQIHTAYIERLNATFRSRLSGLVRRTRNLLRQERTLQAGMYLVGCVYNFCTPHRSLRQALAPGARGGTRWQDRTPAMAAGLTDHVWSVSELLHHRVLPQRPDVSRWRGKCRKGAVSKRRPVVPPPRVLSTV